jgi:hypothetical protein
MLFPTALILALLSITPSLAVPTFGDDSDVVALVARDEPQSILEARGEPYGFDFDMMEKRDLADEEMFEELVARSPEPEPEPEPESDEEMFEQLVARSPEPEPEPLPEGELVDVDRRFFGSLLRSIAKLARKGHKAHHAHQDHRKHHRRDEFGGEGVTELERRFFGSLLRSISKLARKGHKAHQAHQAYENRRKHHKRSEFDGEMEELELRDLVSEEDFEELVARSPEPEFELEMEEY